MTREWVARAVALVLVVGPSLGLAYGLARHGEHVTLRGAMPEQGGWQPGNLTVAVGEPLHVALTSDDVVHGFAVAHHVMEPVDVMPGQVTEVTLRFERPGTYTYYCTRWCGPNHWRMRGTIEVGGSGGRPDTAGPAPYLALGLDIDAPHPPSAVPARQPSAERGAAVAAAQDSVPAPWRIDQSPAARWRELRARRALRRFTDQEVWDLLAEVWRSSAAPGERATGRRLYARNCAACHGESGRGDGVMAERSSGARHDSASAAGHRVSAPTDFSAPALLGASPAVLHGKIVRGGMGTGMPAWGTILTDREAWAVVRFLYGFQFDHQEDQP